MGQAGESARERPAAAWPRRALVSLWLLAFVLGGGILAARWDSLMARLARPPASGNVAGGALR
jgi:hypothetical protein